MMAPKKFGAYDGLCEFLSESLLLNGNWAIFQLYQGEEKLHLDEMIMTSALY